jgi:hypothetical protein
MMKLRVLWSVVASSLFVTSFAVADLEAPIYIDHSAPRLNVLVDNKLTVQMLSSEGLQPFASADKVVGQHVINGLQLSGYDKIIIEVAFQDAHRYKKTQNVLYSLDPDASNPVMGIATPRTAYFSADITPLFDTAGFLSGYFIKVEQLPSHHPVPDQFLE